jgi:hypothetical protein
MRAVLCGDHLRLGGLLVSTWMVGFEEVVDVDTKCTKTLHSQFGNIFFQVACTRTSMIWIGTSHLRSLRTCTSICRRRVFNTPHSAFPRLRGDRPLGVPSFRDELLRTTPVQSFQQRVRPGIQNQVIVSPSLRVFSCHNERKKLLSSGPSGLPSCLALLPRRRTSRRIGGRSSFLGRRRLGRGAILQVMR